MNVIGTPNKCFFFFFFIIGDTYHYYKNTLKKKKLSSFYVKWRQRKKLVFYNKMELFNHPCLT